MGNRDLKVNPLKWFCPPWAVGGPGLYEIRTHIMPYSQKSVPEEKICSTGLEINDPAASHGVSTGKI